MKLKINNRVDRVMELSNFLGNKKLDSTNAINIAIAFAESLYQENIRFKQSAPPEYGSSNYVARHITMLDRALRSVILYSETYKIPDINIGYVYLISNPNFIGFTKIGSAKDAETRLKQYQTGSPFRDYKLEKYILVPNFRDVEKLFLKEYSLDGKYEWTDIPLDILSKHLTRFRNNIFKILLNINAQVY